MYSRAQLILALAIIACSLCLVLAQPAEGALKIRNPKVLGKRQQENGTFDINLGGNDNTAATGSSSDATATPAITITAPRKDTTPLNDGLSKMALLRKEGKKDSKKAKKAAAKAAKAEAAKTEAATQ